MKLALAILCDYANISREGKLNIMGLFDVINAPVIPVRHPLMTLVLRFVVQPSEFRRPQALVIQLADEDGKKIFEINSEITAEGTGPLPARLDQILGLNDLVFPKTGSYSFSILINNNEAANLSLQVNKVDAPTPPRKPDAPDQTGSG